MCRFCVEKIDDINYKDVKMLHAFVAERGKIVPRRISGVCAPLVRRGRYWAQPRYRLVPRSLGDERRYRAAPE